MSQAMMEATTLWSDVDGEPIQRRIDTLRSSRGQSEGGSKLTWPEVRRSMGTVVHEELSRRGWWARDVASDRIYWVENGGKHVIPLGRRSEQAARLLCLAGIGEAESEGHVVAAWLVVLAEETSRPVVVHRGRHLDRETWTWWMHTGRGAAVLKVSPSEITWCRRSDPGVPLFADSLVAHTVVPDIDNPSDEWWTTLMGSLSLDEEAEVSPETARWILTRWIESHWLALDAMPVRPLLVLIGERGSGKTFLARVIGRLLDDPRWDVSSPPRKAYDWYAMVGTRGLVGLDNVEDGSCRELEDWLCRASSGVTEMVRPLYRDPTETLRIPSLAWIVITTRTSPFARPDVAQRSLIVRLSPREGHYSPEEELLGALERERPRMLGHLVHRVQEMLGHLSRSVGVPFRSSLRLADWARYAVVTSGGGRQEFGAIVREQEVFAQSADPLGEIIRCVAEESGQVEVTAGRLLKRLREVAGAHNIAERTLPPTAIGLGRLLLGNLSIYEKFGLRGRIDRSAKQWYWSVLPYSEVSDGVARDKGENEDYGW